MDRVSGGSGHARHGPERTCAGARARAQRAAGASDVSHPATECCEPLVRPRALAHLDEGKVLIFVGGTSNPFFTTDTAAALRAAEIGINTMLKAAQVDSVYDAGSGNEPGCAPLRYAKARRRVETGPAHYGQRRDRPCPGQWDLRLCSPSRHKAAWRRYCKGRAPRPR